MTFDERNFMKSLKYDTNVENEASKKKKEKIIQESRQEE